MEDAKVCAVKEDKHRDLDNAIGSMDDVIHRAYSILRRIQDASDGDSEGTAECKTPSLKEVLDFGADRIREKNGELHKILDEITDNLF
jgi:hypothetical protein